jgi:ribose transport system substrate-binding protein
LHEKSERYVFVASNISLPYWQEAKAGFEDAGQVLGVNREFTGPDIYSPEKQLKTFQEAVASQPSGILISPTRADIFKAPIDAAIQAGIPVICVDSDSPDSKRNTFIGTDNYAAGVESGNLLAKVLQERGLVVVLTIPGQFNLDERLRGARNALGKYSQIKITQVLDDKGDPKQARDHIATLLQQKQRVDGILCLEASGGTGAAKALSEFGMSGKVPVVAMDKNPETLDLIKQGAISATVAQKPYTMSFYGLKLLDDLHHNVVRQFKDWRTSPASPLPAFIDTGTAVVNDKNVEDFGTALVRERRRAQ